MRPVNRQKKGWWIIGFIGYILSPLSPWNDAFVNIPIAVGIAVMASWLGGDWKFWFVVGYVISNSVGLAMMGAAVRHGFRVASARGVRIPLLGSHSKGMPRYRRGSSRHDILESHGERDRGQLHVVVSEQQPSP